MVKVQICLQLNDWYKWTMIHPHTYDVCRKRGFIDQTIPRPLAHMLASGAEFNSANEINESIARFSYAGKLQDGTALFKFEE